MRSPWSTAGLMADPQSFENGTAFQVRAYTGVVWQITLLGGPPNASRISRAALIDRDDIRAKFACQNRHDLVDATAASGWMRMLLECSCSQRSGALNGGRGACYPSRDARWERLRGRALGRVVAAHRAA